MTRATVKGATLGTNFVKDSVRGHTPWKCVSGSGVCEWVRKPTRHTGLSEGARSLVSGAGIRGGPPSEHGKFNLLAHFTFAQPPAAPLATYGAWELSVVKTNFVFKNVVSAALESLVPHSAVSGLPNLLVKGFPGLNLYTGGIPRHHQKKSVPPVLGNLKRRGG